MSPEILTSLISSVGFTTAVAAFLIWRQQEREKRHEEKIDRSEAYIREQLTGLIRHTTSVIERNTGVLEDGIATKNRFMAILESSFKKTDLNGDE